MLIDFPQMVSIDHPNADFYFQRDVTGVRAFFKRRFGIEPPTAEEDEGPKLAEIERRHNLDVELEASGFTRQMRKDLNKVVK